VTLLVLASWALCSAAIVLLGLAPAGIWASSPSLTGLIRRSIWWGLLLGIVLLLVIGLRVPLASAPAALAMGASVICAAVVAALVVRRRRVRHQRGHRPSSADWTVLTALSLAVIALAVAALGPVTNYDTGLYHLGAIRYAAEFAAIPGLANVYFPFGYGNSLFPLAAFLGNGPWGAEGFRLVNGLILVLVLLDLALRMGRRRWSAGTWVLLIGCTAGLAPMLVLADYWVTSPSQDSAVLAVTLVSGAYLVDALSRHATARRSPRPDAVVAIVTAVILVTMRPLMGVFALVTVALALGLLMRRRGTGWARWTVLVGLVLVTAGVQAWRDRILSGWIGYPLDLWPLDVPWRAPAASLEISATLWAARDPELSESWQTASGYGWVAGWIARLPHQWETWVLLALYLAAAAALVVAARSHRRPRHLLWGVAPAVLTIVVWFLATPPAFRFAWGPLILPGAVVLGWCIHAARGSGAIRRIRAGVPVLASAVIVIGSAMSMVEAVGSMRSEQHRWLLGPVAIVYATTPLQQSQVRPVGLGDGLELQYPIDTDQCWRAFPLCTGQLPNTIRWRTRLVIQDGFTP